MSVVFYHSAINAWHFSVVESKAMYGGKPLLVRASYDVTGSDLHYLSPYISLAIPYLKLCVTTGIFIRIFLA